MSQTQLPNTMVRSDGVDDIVTSKDPGNKHRPTEAHTDKLLIKTHHAKHHMPMDAQAFGTHPQGQSAPSDSASGFPDPEPGSASDVQTYTGNNSLQMPPTIIKAPNSSPAQGEDIIDTVS